jgi:hypothetical protein
MVPVNRYGVLANMMVSGTMMQVRINFREPFPAAFISIRSSALVASLSPVTEYSFSLIS